ncbi:MAG: hypothetical protein RR585_10615 [Coprobacillus sp.]
MKKIIILICCCLLCACQAQSDSKSTTFNSQSKEDLIFKGWSGFPTGDGNENGYYHIKMTDKQDRTQSNICYYDYTSKKEVILCNKPECQHQDETCTSYIMLPTLSNRLFVYKNTVFMIQLRGIQIDSLGQRQDTGPKIVKRNLDGSDPQDVYILEDGYRFDYANFAIANDILYIKVVKNKDYKVDKESTMRVNIEEKLYAINLKTGEGKSILDFMDKDIVGTDGRQFILSSTIYKEDPKKYLEAGDYAKYDELMLKCSTGYSTFNIDTLKESEIIKADLEWPRYYKGNIYSTEKDGLYSVNINNGEKKKMISYDLNHSYCLSYISDGYIFINEEKNGSDYIFSSSYLVNIDNLKMQKISFAMRTPKQPIEILSETQDSFLVKYDREGHNEKSWAGTDQYTETKQYIGLIKKSDYFENKANYQNIELLK